MRKRFKDWFAEYGIVLFGPGLILIAIVLMVFTEVCKRPIDHSDLRYFRDDSSQICFAYVDREDFKMITEVDCQKVRW